MFDFRIARDQLLALRKDSFFLRGELFVLLDDQSFQLTGIECFEVPRRTPAA